MKLQFFIKEDWKSLQLQIKNLQNKCYIVAVKKNGKRDPINPNDLFHRKEEMFEFSLLSLFYDDTGFNYDAKMDIEGEKITWHTATSNFTYTFHNTPDGVFCIYEGAYRGFMTHEILPDFTPYLPDNCRVDCSDGTTTWGEYENRRKEAEIKEGMKRLAEEDQNGPINSVYFQEIQKDKPTGRFAQYHRGILYPSERQQIDGFVVGMIESGWPTEPVAWMKDGGKVVYPTDLFFDQKTGARIKYKFNLDKKSFTCHDRSWLPWNETEYLNHEVYSFSHVTSKKYEDRFQVTVWKNGDERFAVIGFINSLEEAKKMKRYEINSSPDGEYVLI